MNNLEYKGYRAKIDYNKNCEAIVGKIDGVKDLVTFEAENVDGVKREFQNAVDDYLEFCAEVGSNPE